MDSPKALALEDINRDFENSAKLLEVGFGDGGFLRSLCRSGFDVVGTEVSKWMVEETQKVLPEAEVLLTDDPSAISQEFQAVCCFEVLEHMTDPLSLAKKLPGKLLYASVPNPWRWYPKLTGKYEYWDYPQNHLWRFCACDPVSVGHHDDGCKLKRADQLAPGQQAMSLRWLLREAGYSQISVTTTPVQAHDILRIIPLRKNVGDYDGMRPKGRLRMFTKAARRMSTPFTYSAATILNLAGYHGVSYYVKASRD